MATYLGKKYIKVIEKGEATAYSLLHTKAKGEKKEVPNYKGKQTSKGTVVTNKCVNKLIAQQRSQTKVNYGDELIIFKRGTNEKIFQGVVDDLMGPSSRPKRNGNEILVDVMLKTDADCINFGRKDVTICVVRTNVKFSDYIKN